MENNGPRKRGRSWRALKKEVAALLSSLELSEALKRLEVIPAPGLINVLFGLLLDTDTRLRWGAVAAMGRTVARMATQNLDSARVVVRRIMWQLNDESGGIGWGCPEALGEICACHEGLAGEYAPILLSYIREDGNFLEYPPLLEGALWGVGRLAQARPPLCQEAVVHLLPFLEAAEAPFRGLAAWALGALGQRESLPRLGALTTDKEELLLFRRLRLERVQVETLAREAIERITG